MLRWKWPVSEIQGFVSKTSGFETALWKKSIIITFLRKCNVYVHLDLIILPVTFFQPAATWKLTAHNSTMESLRVARTRLSQRSVYQKRHRRWSPVFHCHWVSSVTVHSSSRKCPLVREYLPARRSVGEVCERKL